ncbi:MAG: BamA/OMP85 family outer membrane protein [Ignavibacteriaceae bacterium]
MLQKISFTLTIVVLLSATIFSQQNVQYELTTINFVGNNSFSSNGLKEIIVSKESPMWYWKFLNSFSSFGKGPEYFDSTSIPIDLIALKDFYNSNGYFEAKISSSYKIDSLDKTASLTYKISEGRPFTYGKITFRGMNRVIPEITNEVYAVENFNPNTRYSEEIVYSNINKAIDILKNEGYMLAHSAPTEVLIDTAHHKVDLTIFLRTGYRYKINKISIDKTGNGKDMVSDNLLRQITMINPGDYYDRNKIEISQYRLARTGLFNTIQLASDIPDTIGNQVPLLLKGNIGMMNEMSPELVMDNQREEFNMGLGASFIKKNFFGDARKLTLNVKGEILDIIHFNYADFFKSHGRRDSTFQGSFQSSLLLEQPFLFNRPIATSFELYYQSVTQNLTNIGTYGTKLSLDFEMPTYTFITLLNPYLIFEYVGYDPNLNDPTVSLNANSLTTVIGTEFASSKSNDIMFPTRGDNLSFIVEGASSETNFDIAQYLGSNSPLNLNTKDRAIFYKLQETSAFYLPISNDNNATFAIKFETGYIQTIKGGYDVIPPNRTFFAGGSNSVRGWRSRELVPRDSIKYFGLTLSDSLRGGTFLVEGSFEFRRKFWPKVGLVLFSDYGNTWNGYNSFRFNELAVSAGFGFRYYSQIAPFRIDFGFKFYNPADKRTIIHKAFWKQMEIHFGIGEAF